MYKTICEKNHERIWLYRSKHNKPILDFILIDTYNLQYIDDTLTKLTLESMLYSQIQFKYDIV